MICRDGGARHFAETVHAIKHLNPDCTIEVLTPDFQGNEAAVATVAESPIEIFNHNTESVPRLYKRVRPGAKYERSLRVLEKAKAVRANLKTKTGIMLGLGETYEELLTVFGGPARGGVRYPDARAVSPAVERAASG